MATATDLPIDSHEVSSALESVNSDSESVITDSDCEDLEVAVYDQYGTVVDIEKNSRKVISKVPLIRRRGKRGI